MRLPEKKFDWSTLGDIEMGREHLGSDMPVIVYRLMQTTIKDVLVQRYGLETSDDILREAGFAAGLAYGENALPPPKDFNAFVAQLQTGLREHKIGILRVEKADLEKLELVLTVEEDLDCSGLPLMGDAVCVYDEGFIMGLLYGFTGKMFTVKEIDCWATGDRVCRFTARAES